MIGNLPMANFKNEEYNEKVNIKILDIRSGRMIKLQRSPWLQIGQLKSQLQSITGLASGYQRLFCQQYEMNNKDFVLDYQSDSEDQQIAKEKILKKFSLDGFPLINKNYSQFLIPKNSETIRILMCPTLEVNERLGNVQVIKELTDQQLTETFQRVQEGFNAQLKPLPVEDGVSGSYFLRDSIKEQVAIFKCIDEEPFAPNNKKGYIGSFGELSFRNGIKSGELALREVAAYFLDTENIHGVPPTTIAQIKHSYFSSNFGKQDITKQVKKKAFKHKFVKMMKVLQQKKIKIGSLQKLIQKAKCVADISYTLFSNYEVQKIALLDLRILNDDRNDENILYIKQQNQYKLIPIDHGLSLPDSLSICDMNICWLFWKQVKAPIDPALKEYIKKIDPEHNTFMLKKKLDIRDKCLRNLRIAEIFLKKAVEQDLTIFQIAKIMYREDDNQRSELEKIVERAEFIYKKLSKQMPENRILINKIFNCQKNDVQQIDQIIYQRKQIQFSEKKRYRKQTMINLKPLKLNFDRSQSPKRQAKRSFSQQELETAESTCQSIEESNEISDPVFLHYLYCCIDDYFFTYNNMQRKRKNSN